MLLPLKFRAVAPRLWEVRAHIREKACARKPVQLSPGILPRRVTAIHGGLHLSDQTFLKEPEP
ncbi:MAG: hypothetical protein CL534_18780 [Ahrensia sp.]|nr:hypothetical protein [Ahrensia sp.]